MPADSTIINKSLGQEVSEISASLPLSKFLNYEIISFGDHKITPLIIISLVLLLIVSYVVRIILKRVLVGKRDMHDAEYGRRFSIYLIGKYILLIVTVILVLELIGFGLNGLMVGGAALLVGIGMGLQNIFSDFVSGLFLLFERPIEIGDVIEVDNIVGRILQIKLRHTVLVDRNGVNLIIPNHKFITEKVINWSHNREERRFEIEVGVSYKSDVEKVRHILLDVADKHPLVIHKNPEFESFVRFKDFGDSALIFQLFFWSRESFIVENIKSEIRFKIFEEFKNEGIEIPFPQRVLHMPGQESKS